MDYVLKNKAETKCADLAELGSRRYRIPKNVSARRKPGLVTSSRASCTHTPAFHRSRLVRASYKHTKFRLGRCALFIESCDSVLLTFQKVYLHKDVCFTKEEIRKVQFALSYICPTFHLWHGSTHYTWLGNFSATENGKINLDYPI